MVAAMHVGHLGAATPDGHQAELVAADARPRSTRAARRHARRRTSATDAQQVVAGVVAELVVDALEPVDVAHDDAGLEAGLERGLGLGVGDPAVGQARQRVVGDEVAHLRLEVDARDGPGDERGEHLRAGDVVDPERRTRPARGPRRAGPRRCRSPPSATPSALAQRRARASVSTSTGSPASGSSGHGRLVVHRARVGHPAGAVPDQGAQRGTVVGAVGGADHPDRRGGRWAAGSTATTRQVSWSMRQNATRRASSTSTAGGRGDVGDLVDRPAAVEAVRRERERAHADETRGGPAVRARALGGRTATRHDAHHRPSVPHGATQKDERCMRSPVEGKREPLRVRYERHTDVHGPSSPNTAALSRKASGPPRRRPRGRRRRAGGRRAARGRRP